LASTYTPNLALEIPAHGDYASTGWDNPMDNSLRTLDTSYGGYLSLANTGGVTQLTLAQASNPVIVLTGTLTSNAYVYFPPIAGRRIILPACNMNGFALFVRGNNGVDQSGVYFWNGFGVPYGIVVLPNRVSWDYGALDAGSIVDKPTGYAGNGWLPLDGRWVNMGLHDILWDVVGGTWGSSGTFPSGSFKLGDFRGTTRAMADQIGTVPGAGPFAQDMGNRGILNSWGLNTFAGEAYHTLSVAELAYHGHGVIDPGHTHGVSDPGHTHGMGGSYGYGIGSIAPPNPLVRSGDQQSEGSATHISIIGAGTGITIGGMGSNAAHNNVQPTTTTMAMIKW